MSSDQPADDLNEEEFIRTAVSELNESIAYLSQMVLHLQRSINEQKTTDPLAGEIKTPKTIH